MFPIQQLVFKLWREDEEALWTEGQIWDEVWRVSGFKKEWCERLKLIISVHTMWKWKHEGEQAMKDADLNYWPIHSSTARLKEHRTGDGWSLHFLNFLIRHTSSWSNVWGFGELPLFLAHLLCVSFSLVNNLPPEGMSFLSNVFTISSCCQLKLQICLGTVTH